MYSMFEDKLQNVSPKYLYNGKSEIKVIIINSSENS